MQMRLPSVSKKNATQPTHGNHGSARDMCVELRGSSKVQKPNVSPNKYIAHYDLLWGCERGLDTPLEGAAYVTVVTAGSCESHQLRLDRVSPQKYHVLWLLV